MVIKKIIFTGITFLFLNFFFLYFLNIAPDSTIHEESDLSKLTQELAPQGFGFYSKSPTDENIMFKSNQKIYLPNAKPENFFGISRYGRAQAVELGKIIETLPENSWRTCELEVDCEKMETDLKPIKVLKTNQFSNLQSGVYILSKQAPISWYFRKYKETTSFKRKVVKIKLENKRGI